MRYVIIGNSAAGIAAAQAIRGRDKHGSIMILSKETCSAYYRPLMPLFIDGRVSDDALYQVLPQSLLSTEIRLGAEVRMIDTECKELSLASGEILPYDRLLISTGSSAQRLSIPGLEPSEVHVLRNMADVEAIKLAAEGADRALVIGAGRVGTKAAMALRRRGLDVAVVEQGDRVVPFQFDDKASQIVRRGLEGWGIQLHLERTVRGIEKVDGKVAGVVLDSEEFLKADFVIVAVGIKPNADLGKQAGMLVRTGLVTDRFLQTTAPGVYAAGDVAETVDLITGENVVPGTWTAAVEMGRVAGGNMAGAKHEYPGALPLQNSFVIANIPTVSIGMVHAREGDGPYTVVSETRGETYRKLVFSEKLLVGALLVGDIDAAGFYNGLIKAGTPVESSREKLLDRRPGHALWGRHMATACGLGSQSHTNFHAPVFGHNEP